MKRLISAVAAVLLLCVLGARPTLASDASSAHAATSNDSVSITGAVEHARTLTLADLRREPVVTESVSLKTGKGVLSGSFSGALLWDLLRQAVIKSPPGSKNDVLRHTVLVVGSDGYSAVLSAAEIDPELGGERALLAYAKDGQPLSDARGAVRLILPADKSAARAISGVTRIVVQ